MLTDVFIKGYQPIKREGTVRVTGFFRMPFSIRGGITDLDMNDDQIKSIINYSGTNKLELDHFSKAIFHRYNNNLVDCIKDLVKNIENNTVFLTMKNMNR